MLRNLVLKIFSDVYYTSVSRLVMNVVMR